MTRKKTTWKLTNKQKREVFDLRQEGITAKEIAEVYGVTVATVYSTEARVALKMIEGETHGKV